MRRLNNLVAELADHTGPFEPPSVEVRFTNPRTGWVFVGARAKLRPEDRLRLAMGEHLVADWRDGAGPFEVMRFLPSGEHVLHLRIDGRPEVERLTVRAVPELVYCKFPRNPHIAEFGPYDWEFLRRHVLGHVNTTVGTGEPEHRQYVSRWKARGGRWIVECYLPGLERDTIAADEVYRVWAENPGMSDPQLDGLIVDEFLKREDPKYDAWTEAFRRIREQFPEKLFYPYCGAVHRAEKSAQFLKTVLEAEQPFAWEVYLQEQPTVKDAIRHLEERMAGEMRHWEKVFPGCTRRMIMCLGYLTITESLDINPQVDYKVWMDMQFHHLANDPAFDGLYGLMEYTSAYADEETVRWAARLYRHYGIEGQTELLSPRYGFHYMLDHIGNADFAEGLTGWHVRAAEEGSIEPRWMEGYSWLQGRFPRTEVGDTFLWMRRCAGRPNVVSQPIGNLAPGRLYSLTMITGDHGELVSGTSTPQTHAVSIEIEGGEVIPEKSFQTAVPNNYAHTLGPFDARNHFWFTYHRIVFRAKGSDAFLHISDWATPQEPGGPIGQELMYNFIEVQPYFEG